MAHTHSVGFDYCKSSCSVRTRSAQRLKVDAHYLFSRTVFTGRGNECYFGHPTCKYSVENNYDIINNSACRSRWPVCTGVQK